MPAKRDRVQFGEEFFKNQLFWLLGPEARQVNRPLAVAVKHPGECSPCRNHAFVRRAFVRRWPEVFRGLPAALERPAQEPPLASTAVSAASPPPAGNEGDEGNEGGKGNEGATEAAADVSAGGPPSATMAPIDVTPDDQRRAGEALRASFARLAPQGSDEWNFMGAFTLLGDRFGPYQPGASELADVLSGGADDRGAGRRATGRLGRLRAGGAPSPEAEKSDFDEAMGHIIEAFRFLHARVSTLEARIAAEDVPLDGAAWLAPARELGLWVEPVVAYIEAHTPGADVVHADCGDGALVLALTQGATSARGVEPRGAIALRALERGCAVTISEVSEYLATCAEGSLGGLVLSGVVDRLPLRRIIPLLAQSRQALAPAAPVVVVSEAPTGLGPEHEHQHEHEHEPENEHRRSELTARDLLDARSLHSQTWGLLLERCGFVDIGGLAGPVAHDDQRFGVTATTPLP